MNLETFFEVIKNFIGKKTKEDEHNLRIKNPIFEKDGIKVFLLEKQERIEQKIELSNGLIIMKDGKVLNSKIFDPYLIISGKNGLVIEKFDKNKIDFVKDIVIFKDKPYRKVVFKFKKDGEFVRDIFFNL